jgi:hypothetical protein
MSVVLVSLMKEKRNELIIEKKIKRRYLEATAIYGKIP